MAIEKLEKDDDAVDFAYTDPGGTSWNSPAQYIQIEFLGLCGCGDPDAVMDYLGELLERIEQGNPPEGEGLDWIFFLYWADDKEFADHGTSIRGAWLTEKGKEILNDIRKIKEARKETGE